MKYYELIASLIGVLPGMLLSERSYKSKRLKRLLKKTKKSKFYQNIYNGINTDDITLENLSTLPPVTKQQILNQYNEWTCNGDIKKEEINEFISSVDNLDKLFLDKYKVDSTSGTTGVKFVVPSTEKDINHMMAMGAWYTWPKLSYIIDILTSNRPVVYIIPSDGFYASVFVAKTYLGFSKNKKSAIIDFKTPTSELVKRLNEINPILIGGYVTTMLLLADEANEKRLNIDVKYMVTIGSAYSEESRAKISKAFNCKTFTSYSCTEGGEVGCECINGHYHLSREVIVETVDNQYHPVEYGKESDCILLTNLWNTTAPFIRYRVDDRCVLHNEPCGCGRKSKWLEVKGRETANISFTQKDGNKISLSSLIFEIILVEIGKFTTLQLIIDSNNLEFRIKSDDEALRATYCQTLKEKLNEIEQKNNIEFNVTLSDENPFVGNTGKFQMIVPKKSNIN